MTEFWDVVINKVTTLLPNLAIALFVFLAGLYFSRLLGSLVERVLKRREADPGVTTLLAQTARWTVIVAGVIAALQRFFNVTAFLAGLGIIGFTIGFALQNVMQNFAAGIILLIQQPFKVGESIEVDGFGGTVLEINLRSTEMRTFDGRVVVLPNADLLAHPITNFTRSERRRVELPVGVAYGSDLDAARSAVLEALPAVPGFVSDPAPMVVFHTFNDSSVDLTAYFWLDTSQTNPLAAKDEALTRVKRALDARGIEIPFPIRTVYMQTHLS
jgi:small conductance mechanosensitive channel